MDTQAVFDRMRALVADDSKRSRAARLRDVIDSVEAALSAGVPRSAVLRELAALGLDMSMATFETTLKRIRQKRRNPSSVGGKTSRRLPSQATPLARLHAESAPPEHGSYHPGDIDSIRGNWPDVDALAKLAKKRRR